MKPDPRRVYYDHEPGWKRIAARDGRGWDDNFPEKAGQDQGSYLAIDDFLAANAPPRAGARALDLGCGGGQVAFKLARHGYAVRAIDFSETAIELARRNASDARLDIDFARGDALALDDPDGAFDLVVDNHMLHCIVEPADRARCLAGIRRVLAPGGVFFSEMMSCEDDFDPARFDADPTTRIARNHTRIWVSLAELRAELAAARLAPVREEVRRQPAREGSLIVIWARGA